MLSAFRLVTLLELLASFIIMTESGRANFKTVNSFPRELIGFPKAAYCLQKLAVEFSDDIELDIAGEPSSQLTSPGSLKSCLYDVSSSLESRITETDPFFLTLSIALNNSAQVLYKCLEDIYRIPAGTSFPYEQFFSDRIAELSDYIDSCRKTSSFINENYKELSLLFVELSRNVVRTINNKSDLNQQNLEAQKQAERQKYLEKEFKRISREIESSEKRIMEKEEEKERYQQKCSSKLISMFKCGYVDPKLRLLKEEIESFAVKIEDLKKRNDCFAAEFSGNTEVNNVEVDEKTITKLTPIRNILSYIQCLVNDEIELWKNMTQFLQNLDVHDIENAFIKILRYRQGQNADKSFSNTILNIWRLITTLHSAIKLYMKISVQLVLPVLQRTCKSLLDKTSKQLPYDEQYGLLDSKIEAIANQQSNQDDCLQHSTCSFNNLMNLIFK